MAADRQQIADWFKSLQSEICSAIENEDGKAKFKSDSWQRPGGGGGDTRVIENGLVIEKGGVNFSAVHGSLPSKIMDSLKVNSDAFFATGVSIVMHPENPMVPIIHMNVRYFELNDGNWWFGGGIDLTPHYYVEDQSNWFHNQLKQVCDDHDEDFYSEFSQWANNYFFIKHRAESRGVSGIFFDRLNENRGKSKQELFDFIKAVGNSFAPIYIHLMHLNKAKPYNERHKAWQLHRRSRYVEFNLVYDKGTKFGLDTEGRIDSVLMSLPPLTGWNYTQNWPDGGEEKRTEHVLKTLYVP